MADKPEQNQVPVTSEKKKDPKRVAAGKRLSAIGVAIALISLVLAYKTHQRETKEPEPEYIPKTVEVTKRADESKLDSLE
ncbi:Hypothetical predicted protein [Paramuricea clavata]|uniref:Uncharacterized protein n=1 Tax=Paramuricea clavata TaxID=317549 RepID=A0A6S7FJZ9_PARCT|nr:Hypothetical predicted protein [Paramuricea clavata]